METERRKVEVLVISDVHLGTYGCRAKELKTYLKQVDIGHLILNGDIIDIWQFKKWYWPKNHMKVVRQIMKLVGNGTPVTYITGNHDEVLRKFNGQEMGSLKVLNQLTMELNGKKHWFFHGDVFDYSMKHSKWLAKLGGWSYDILIMLNSLMNYISEKLLGRGRISLSKKIKGSVKSAVSFISDFEESAALMAIEREVDVVVCGHIHQPEMKTIDTDKGSVHYLNSGDWIENLTALEFNEGEWSLYRYSGASPEEEEEVEEERFQELLEEFKLVRV